MVLRVYKDGIIRARSHTRLATNADRFIEIDNTIRPLEHSRCRARSHTGCMGALITASDLMRAPHLRKRANLNVFDVGARHRQRNKVL